MGIEVHPNVRYLKYNFLGEGKSSGEKGSYWYRDDVMFYNETPSWRTVEGPNGKVLLVKHMGFHPGYYKSVQVPYSCNVPDLGVFSKYENDKLTDVRQINERVRFIMLSRHRDEIARTIECNAVTLASKVANLRSTLKMWRAQYVTYNKLMGAGWNEMPTIWEEQLEQVVQQKLKDYNDPRAVARRERSKARKIAMEAIGASS